MWLILLQWRHLCLGSVVQSCSTLYRPMDRSMARLPCPSPTLELAQTHIHRVGDAIQPSHLCLYLQIPLDKFLEPESGGQRFHIFWVTLPKKWHQFTSVSACFSTPFQYRKLSNFLFANQLVMYRIYQLHFCRKWNWAFFHVYKHVYISFSV